MRQRRMTYWQISSNTFQIIGNTAWIGSQCGQCLSRINCAATADGNEQIRFFIANVGCAKVHILDCRLAFWQRKNGKFDLRVRKAAGGLGQNSALLQMGTANAEQCPLTKTASNSPKLAEFSDAENNFAGCVKSKVHAMFANSAAIRIAVSKCKTFIDDQNYPIKPPLDGAGSEPENLISALYLIRTMPVVGRIVSASSFTARKTFPPAFVASTTTNQSPSGKVN